MSFTPVLVLAGLLLLFSPASAAADTLPAPQLLSPADGTVTTAVTPHLQWEPLFGAVDVLDPRLLTYEVQIGLAAAKDPFAAPVLADSVHVVITRFLSVRALPPADYVWRVRALPPADSRHQQSVTPGEWSSAWRLTVRLPKRTLHVAADADMATLAAVVADAVSTGDATVLLAPGAQMRLAPTPSAQQSDQYVFNLTQTHDVVIDGQGADLTITAYIGFVFTHNCTRCSVRNMSFDLDPVPYTALNVTALAGTTDAPAFIGTLFPGHPLLESNPGFNAPTIGGLMDASLLRDKRGSEEVISIQNWTRLAIEKENDLPTYHVDLPPGHGYQDVAPGDVYYLDPRIEEGLRIEGGEDVILANVTVYSCPNECFTSQHAEGLGILGCRMLVKPGRFIAANNGGHNHHSAHLGAWIEGGEFENNGDDMCHVSGIVSSAKAIVSPTQVMLEPTWPDHWAARYNGVLGYAVGDTLAFWDRGASRMISTRVITALSDPDAQGLTPVTLDGPVGPIVPGSIGGVRPLHTVTRPPRTMTQALALGFNGSVTQVFNLNRTANQLVFRRNVYRNGRRVALLAKGYRALVEDNFVQGTGGGGVELWPAPYEGLCASEYVIRNNFFNDTNQLSRTSAPIWTSAFGSAGSGQCHGTILIQNNTIQAGPGSTFLLSDAKHVVIERCVIERCGTDPEPPVTTSNVGIVSFDTSNAVHNSTASWLCTK